MTARVLIISGLVKWHDVLVRVDHIQNLYLAIRRIRVLQNTFSINNSYDALWRDCYSVFAQQIALRKYRLVCFVEYWTRALPMGCLKGQSLLSPSAVFPIDTPFQCVIRKPACLGAAEYISIHNYLQ